MKKITLIFALLAIGCSNDMNCDVEIARINDKYHNMIVRAAEMGNEHQLELIEQQHLRELQKACD